MKIALHILRVYFYYRDEPKIIEAFKTGKGIAWGDRHKDLYEGTERSIDQHILLILLAHGFLLLTMAELSTDLNKEV